MRNEFICSSTVVPHIQDTEILFIDMLHFFFSKKNKPYFMSARLAFPEG